MSLIMNAKLIRDYIHCGLCIKEVMASLKTKSPQIPKDSQNIEVGWTVQGLQVWCKKHDCNILHVDFEGIKHHADTTRKKTDEESR